MILATILISAANALMRKAFDVSSNAWLELQWLLFGAVFMLSAAYALQKNAHVRIDVMSSRLSKHTRDVIDLCGHLFILLPFTLIVVWLSAPFFLESWREGEISSNAGGLAVWPGKFLIFAGMFLLLLQALSEIVKRIAVLRGVIADPEPQPVHGHSPSDTSVTGGHIE
ncbi:TRAP transporter small permease subunit [Aestuariivirga sp.]|uniref:TRAP transporter small permease subunit n=1 Tax=Aestuariivirga sp. TaxID=2650926 RepID=UPI003BAB535C